MRLDLVYPQLFPTGFYTSKGGETMKIDFACSGVRSVNSFISNFIHRNVMQDADHPFNDMLVDLHGDYTTQL